MATITKYLRSCTDEVRGFENERVKRTTTTKASWRRRSGLNTPSGEEEAEEEKQEEEETEDEEEEYKEYKEVDE